MIDEYNYRLRLCIYRTGSLVVARRLVFGSFGGEFVLFDGGVRMGVSMLTSKDNGKVGRLFWSSWGMVEYGKVFSWKIIFWEMKIFLSIKDTVILLAQWISNE